MKIVCSALLCALAIWVVGVHALPAPSDFFSTFERAVRRSMTIPRSQMRYKRGLGLLTFAPDQTSVQMRQDACTTTCSDSGDSAILENSIGNATCALDTGCVCNGIDRLSSACQTCILAAEGYTTSTFRSACGAATSVIAIGTAVASAEEALETGTGSCLSQCGNETEIAGLDVIVGCGNSALCICSATNVTGDSALSQGCLSCLLQQSGTTVSGLQSMCNVALASGSPSGVPSMSGSLSAAGTSSASGASPSTSASTTSNNSGALRSRSGNEPPAICVGVLAISLFLLV